MEITIKTPSGTDVIVNLATNTVSVDKVNMKNEPIAKVSRGNFKDFGLMDYIDTVKDEKILISAEGGKKLQSATMEYKRQQLEIAVPGVEVLRDAIYQQNNYFSDFNRMMDDEQNDGVNPPIKPTLSLEELNLKYPRAALYLTAEAYECAGHFAKTSAGTRAKKLLADGGSIEDAKKILDTWSDGLYFD